MSLTLIISTIVGVITGVIANILTHIWQRVGVPYYLNRVYQGYRVDGTWTVAQEERAGDGIGFENTWTILIHLKQSAQTITGHGTATRNESVLDNITYKVNGMIRDGFIQIYLCPQEQTRIAFSCFLLKVHGDGTIMSGQRLFYGFVRNDIRSVKVNLKRSH